VEYPDGTRREENCPPWQRARIEGEGLTRDDEVGDVLVFLRCREGGNDGGGRSPGRGGCRRGCGPRRPLRQPLSGPALLSSHDGLVVRLAKAACELRSLPGGELDPARISILADLLTRKG
jgi:hypothetical protein